METVRIPHPVDHSRQLRRFGCVHSFPRRGHQRNESDSSKSIIEVFLRQRSSKSIIEVFLRQHSSKSIIEVFLHQRSSKSIIEVFLRQRSS